MFYEIFQKLNFTTSSKARRAHAGKAGRAGPQAAAGLQTRGDAGLVG